MRYLLFLALLCAGMIIAGCISIPVEINATGGTGGGMQEPPEVIVNPFTAKEGLPNATTAMLALWNDAVLVSVYGNCENDGKAMEWQYSFDSLASKKGYTVAMPGDGMIRDKPFSFGVALGNQWIDSTDAVRACGKSGECSLEIREGTAVWTVVSGNDVCEVDASNGEVLG